MYGDKQCVCFTIKHIFPPIYIQLKQCPLMRPRERGSDDVVTGYETEMHTENTLRCFGHGVTRNEHAGENKQYLAVEKRLARNGRFMYTRRVVPGTK